jgi:Domain of unknown function (DUF4329)
MSVTPFFRWFVIAVMSILAVLVAAGVRAADQYPTEQEAAEAALQDCIGRSVQFEYAGGVYQDRGGYFYTVPFSSGSERDVETFKIAMPRGAQLVALYHTHPQSGLPGDNSEVISDADIATANSMRVTSYVGVMKTHKIVMYIPHHTPVFHRTDSFSHADLKVSYGQPVGALQ